MTLIALIVIQKTRALERLIIDRPENRSMKMKHVAVVFIALLAGMEGRSLIPSSMEEAIKYWEPKVLQSGKETEMDPMSLMDSDLTALDKKLWNYPVELRPFIVTQGRKLEKLLAEFAERTADARDYGQRATQWLKQLKLILKELSGEPASKAKNSDKANEVVDSTTTMPPSQDKQVSKGINSLKDLIGTADELDIYYQDGQDEEREKHVKSRHEDASAMLPMVHEKAAEDEDTMMDMRNGNGAEQLDGMLLEVQSQISRIRKFFDRLCRKHHSMPEHNVDHSTTLNQPKKISISMV